MGDISQSQMPRFNLIAVLIEIGIKSIGCGLTVGIIKRTKVVPYSTFEERKKLFRLSWLSTTSQVGDIREKTDQSEDNVSVHCQHCQPSVSKDEDDVQNRGG